MQKLLQPTWPWNPWSQLRSGCCWGASPGWKGKSITSFSVIYKQQATNGFINHPGISSMAKWLEKRGFFFVLLSSCHEKLQWNLKTWSFTKENLLVTTELQYPFCGVDKKFFLSRWWWNKFLLSHKDRMEWMGFFFSCLFTGWWWSACFSFCCLFVLFLVTRQLEWIGFFLLTRWRWNGWVSWCACWPTRCAPPHSRTQRSGVHCCPLQTCSLQTVGTQLLLRNEKILLTLMKTRMETARSHWRE